MSVNERELFKKYIMDAKVYLEFGSGGSTITALNETMCNAYSEESSKEWISHMKKTYSIITESIDSGRLSYIYTDIGTTGEWGTPVNNIDGIGSLMICKRKENISFDEIENEYNNYKYNYK